MTTPVNDEVIGRWRAAALAYLRKSLGARAPHHLGSHHFFETSPLEGEGPIVLFEFELSSASKQERFFVATGQTEPNYYAALNLSPEDMFALHLGTRFMLVLGVALMPQPDRAAFDLEKAVRELVWSIRPGQPVSEVEWAATFDVEGRMHGVARCRIGPERAFAFIGEAPHGFSTEVDIAPQVAYRIHLGRALLAESKPIRDQGGDEMETGDLA